MGVEYNWLLGSKQYEALFASPTPLTEIFHHYEDRETDYMENLRMSAVDIANSVIAEQATLDQQSVAEQPKESYLKAAEEYVEENYDMIGGCMSAQDKLIPDDNTKSQLEQCPSILEKLHSNQNKIAAKAEDAPVIKKPIKKQDISIK